MCGIWLLKTSKNVSIDNFYKLRHRGPDISTLKTIGDTTFGIHRLTINGLNNSADQPFYYKGHYCICNGEIYNYKKLAEKYNILLTTGSDCEIILPLYDLLGADFVKELLGEFAIIIIKNNGEILTYRDHFGKRPLFMQCASDFICISSEMKSMYINHTPTILYEEYTAPEYPIINVFEPRTYALIKNYDISITEWYNLESALTNVVGSVEKIRQIMAENIEMMIKSDVKVGALLSGGLDSSIVVYELARILPYKLNTYSIGLPGGSDEKYARLMADFAGTNHTHIYLTEEEMRQVIPEIVYTTESYDITTVRASIGQYLVCKHVKEKVLFVSDGSDEEFSGYFYFYNAPSLEEMHYENIRLINEIHLYDGLRMDRCPARFGIEIRAPFLIHTFVENCLSINPELRMPKKLTKELLREVYKNDLPPEILQRPKEAFSDGMTIGMTRPIYEILNRDNDNELIYRDYNCPTTAESSYYRLLWENWYTNPHVIKAFWLPRWCNVNDPCALLIKINN